MPRSRRSCPPFAIALATVAIVLVISGCGGATNSSPEASGGVPQMGGTLRVAILGEVDSLTPATSLLGIDVITQINEPLFLQNEAGDLVPLLATGLKESRDGRTFTVSIRPHVHFSNGKPLTAKDVVFSIDAARTSPYMAELYAQIEHVGESDPLTVTIRTKKPVPAMKADLAAWVAAIVPDNYEGHSAEEFSEHPIGTGPFMFKSWKHGQSIALVRNPNYWKPNEPRLNEVVFPIVPDISSQTDQLRGGEIDAMFEPPFAQIEGLEQAGFQHGLSPLNTATVLLLNQRKPLFRDPRVREAIDLAIDRKGIISTATRGRGKPAGSFLVPNVPYFDKSIKAPEQDLEKAKALVEEATKEGLDPKLTLMSWTGQYVQSIASQVVQQNLEQVGFKVSIEPIELATGFERLEEGKFDATFNEYYSAVADPSELTTFFLASLAPGMGVDVAQLTQLAESAATARDPQERQELYSQLQERIASERDLISVIYRPEVIMHAPGVVGLVQNPTNGIDLRQTGWAE